MAANLTVLFRMRKIVLVFVPSPYIFLPKKGSEMKNVSSTETTFCVESGHISLIKQGLTIITIVMGIISGCSKEVFCPVR